ncbi:hypothetical protein UFOVP20_51 [uncultured Caudovirales phage]|uniref:Uncharacterized protein n=1 Tax=uncultured Caudovirales phage TaxID=2100421 RepID=A0A6J5KPM1_9CAUD|nr:hypothetical protein UFOVP20_51 [uncultured Caudovirales phage]
MSRNGSGVYTLPAGNPVVTATTISSTWANNTLTDIANSLTQSLAADGQTPATGALNLNNNQINNLASPTLSTDAVNYSTFLLGNFATTGAITLPVGDNASRPVVPATGMIRYNVTGSGFEGYTPSGWSTISSGATGGGGDQIFVQNGQTVTTDYTIPIGFNASTVGPITIADNVVVTISAGSVWAVI